MLIIKRIIFAISRPPEILVTYILKVDAKHCVCLSLLHISLPLAICLNTHSFRWNIAESILGVFEKLNSLRFAAIACSWKLSHSWLSVESQGLETKYLQHSLYLWGRSKNILLCALLSEILHPLPLGESLPLQGSSACCQCRDQWEPESRSILPEHRSRCPIKLHGARTLKIAWAMWIAVAVIKLHLLQILSSLSN